jgi:DNA repair protein RecO (recombination protein O)
MLAKTQGIVLKSFKFRENSLITDIFTSEFGLRSYIINSVFSKKGISKAAYFQPMSILDLVVYEKEERSLNRIQEIRPAHIFNQIPYDIVRSSISMFISEILRNVLKERSSNQALFNNVRSMLMELDQTTETLSTFHLYFLVRMFSDLGIYPHGDCDEPGVILDMREGVFTNVQPLHFDILDPPTSLHFYHLINKSGDLYLNNDFPKIVRRQLTEALIRYYQIHVHQFDELKTLPVLSQVLSLD